MLVHDLAGTGGQPCYILHKSGVYGLGFRGDTIIVVLFGNHHLVKSTQEDLKPCNPKLKLFRFSCASPLPRWMLSSFEEAG